MLRAQGLNEEQKVDFIYGALEGDAKREMRLLNPGRRSTSVDMLQELKRLYGRVTPVAQLRAQFFKMSPTGRGNCCCFHSSSPGVILRMEGAGTSGLCPGPDDY